LRSLGILRKKYPQNILIASNEYIISDMLNDVPWPRTLSLCYSTTK